MMWPERRHWYGALVWLFFTTLGMLIPLGAGGILVLAISNIKLGDFTDGGQFAIYSAAMLVGTLYSVIRPTTIRLPLSEWFVWVTVIGLIAALLFFVLSTLLAKGFDIENWVLRWPSITLFIVSVILAFVAVVLDNRRMEVDIIGNRQRQQEDLNEAFEGTEE